MTRCTGDSPKHDFEWLSLLGCYKQIIYLQDYRTTHNDKLAVKIFSNPPFGLVADLPKEQIKVFSPLVAHN
jgi:hypothetical protein